MLRVGDKVRTTKGDRRGPPSARDKRIIKIAEVGRKWRHFDAVIGRRGQWIGMPFNGYKWGKKHIYLVKNLVRM